MERRDGPQEAWFEDRRAAGKALADAMIEKQVSCTVVLGLIRGGVPVASEVATALNCPMDILAVKKLRSPINEELGVGAICADGTRVLHQEMLQELGVSEDYLELETKVRLAEAQESERMCRGHHPPLDLAGQSVVIVDDGIATGGSMEAGVLSVREHGAASILVAAPVGSSEACSTLLKAADDVFCLTTPVDFWAVGQYYRHFSEVPNEVVRLLLDENRALFVR